MTAATGKSFTVTIKPHEDGRGYLEVRGGDLAPRQRPFDGVRPTYAPADAAQHAERIARGLRELGHEVAVINEQREAQAA